MPNVIEVIKNAVRGVAQIGAALLPLVLVIGVLFGVTTEFVTGDVIGNLMDFISTLGSEGLAGWLALAIVVWVFAGTGIFRAGGGGTTSY